MPLRCRSIAIKLLTRSSAICHNKGLSITTLGSGRKLTNVSAHELRLPVRHFTSLKSMTYAIIETGGKQMRVEPGRFYDIELLPGEVESTVSIDKVFLLENNGSIQIGQPLVTGVTVEGTIMRHYRARKIIVYKMQPKKKTRKKRGHRQEMTRLMIDSISVNGAIIAEAAKAEAEAVAA